ncbi:MAG: ABC transporter ATP-binding protein [Dehalococcoidia bacterium]
MDSPLLEVRDLTVEALARRLLDRVSLQAGKGEFIGLVGPNGAGKTTLIRAILGLVRHREGVVWVDGHSIKGISPRRMARLLGYLPQALPPTYGFTALEVVLMGCYPSMGLFQIEGDKEHRIALEAMRLTQTDAFASRQVATLSGGERQRVFLARALAQQPRLLLLDEPIANLDIHHQIKVLEMVRGMVENGLTAIAALHNLELAVSYCHRLVLLHCGRVVAEGEPERVLTPDNLQTVFGVSALVYRDPASQRIVITPSDCSPSRRRTLRVHVVCGGGSGAHLMYLLRREGFAVTAGPLGAGDTDRLAASSLGIPFIPLPAFSPVHEEAYHRHLNMVARADVAVLCPMPIGPNNLRNLEALQYANHLVSLEGEPFTQRDFTGGRASEVFQTLTPSARCNSPQDALALLVQWDEEKAMLPSHSGR